MNRHEDDLRTRRYDDERLTLYTILTIIPPPNPRQGRFTLALVKILVSEMARNAMYESVITSIGRLGRMQVPVAVGSHARLMV